MQLSLISNGRAIASRDTRMPRFPIRVAGAASSRFRLDGAIRWTAGSLLVWFHCGCPRRRSRRIRRFPVWITWAYAQTAGSLSATHRPGSLPELLRGHAPQAGGEAPRPAGLSLWLRRRFPPRGVAVLL